MLSKCFMNKALKVQKIFAKVTAGEIAKQCRCLLGKLNDLNRILHNYPLLFHFNKLKNKSDINTECSTNCVPLNSFDSHYS